MEEKTSSQQLFEKCSKELDFKSGEYGPVDNTGSDYDVMAAFEERKPTEVCFSLLLKHITVLKKIAKNPDAYTYAKAEHRAIDAINFIAILLNEIKKFKGGQVECQNVPNAGFRNLEFTQYDQKDKRTAP